MKLQLKVKKEECTDTCPMPLNMLAMMKKEITKVEYDEEKGMAVVEFDEQAISQEDVLDAIKKMRYEVLEVTHG